MRNHGSEAHLDRLLRLADPDNPNVLTIGFARRFATYKRATLLFENLDWLREILSDPQRPVLFMFAGKAHPADQPGQDLIRRIAEVARLPEFEGHILLVEGYDLQLARRLVSGVDVWLNNPIYPLEASGTSGMKAAMNGVINLSVLDGWWGEGYDGNERLGDQAGARPTADEARARPEEARTLYELLQDSVIPLYYSTAARRATRRAGWRWPSARSPRSCRVSIRPAWSANTSTSITCRPRPSSGSASPPTTFPSRVSSPHGKRRIRAAWPGVALRRLDDSATPHRLRRASCASRSPSSSMGWRRRRHGRGCCSAARARTDSVEPAATPEPLA